MKNILLYKTSTFPRLYSHGKKNKILIRFVSLCNKISFKSRNMHQYIKPAKKIDLASVKSKVY